MQKAITRFRDFVVTKGLRYTKEREQIVLTVFENHGHFCVEGLQQQMDSAKAAPSRATFYRTLPLLVECGLIREVGRRDGELYYEHIFDHQHHDHMVCQVCGLTIEFYYDAIEILQQYIAQKYEFKLTGHFFTLQGVCKQCREATTR